MKHASGYCKCCDRRVRAERRSCNHLLHVVLCIVTVGLWFPFWVIAWLNCFSHHWRCTSCGSVVRRVE